MTRFAIGLVLVTVFFIAGCGRNQFEQEIDLENSAVTLLRQSKSGDYDLITAAELKELIDKNETMVIVDTMPYEASYKKEHVPGAKHFLFPKDKEMTEWDSKKTNGKSEKDYEKVLGEDKDKLIVVYCGFVKCLRSHNAALWARKLGYSKVKRFAGGIYAWKGAEHEMEGE